MRYEAIPETSADLRPETLEKLSQLAELRGEEPEDCLSSIIDEAFRQAAPAMKAEIDRLAALPRRGEGRDG